MKKENRRKENHNEKTNHNGRTNPNDKDTRAMRSSGNTMTPHKTLWHPISTPILFLHHYVGHKRERIAYAPGNSRGFRGMDPGGDLHGNIRSGTIRKVFQTQERQEGFRRLRGRAGTVRKAFQSQNQSQKRFVGDRSIRDRSLRSIRVRSILFRARIIHGFKIRNVFSPR